MIDFKNNTYTVTQAEKAEVIKILKRHPEYQFSLWQMLEEEFQYHEDIIYLDNAYITSKDIAKNPDIVKCAELYTAAVCCQHKPQPLLQSLRQIDKQLIRMD